MASASRALFRDLAVFMFLATISVFIHGGPAANELSIDAAAGRHPISADIYGMNYADEQLAAELNLPVRRWGGNSTSRYNWQTSMYNTGSDWYFENIPDGAAVANGSASDRFVDQDRRTGTRTLMTVPLIGWTPKSGSPRSHSYACGFKVSKYGAQQSTDSEWDPDCGNGVNSGGTDITGNDPADTSTAITPSFVSGWINHLTGKYGTATNGGVAYYNLDNEPMLWNSTHRDVNPQAATYDELRDRTWQYAAAVKSADPSAKTLGPVLWGWCAYFYSALDECGAKNSDYNAHGQTYFVPWYLQQMKAYEDQHGVRILDYLDLHNYPAANGVSLKPAGSSSTQAIRLRSTRSLWDPSYKDESWISDLASGGVAVQLIPRMKSWVNDNYPGTKLAITEYNWGGLESINGALAQADVLGIFGREGLDLATIWSPPKSAQPGAYAFRIYRNYDGNGHGFGDIGIQSASTDQEKLAVYAAQRSSDNALTAVVINKSGSSQTSTVNLAGFTPQSAASVYRYSPANLNAIEHLADQALTASGFSTTFPANSITLYVIHCQFDLLTDFTGTPTTGPIPLYVCFTDASTDNPTSWDWDFGDGNSASGQNPCHGYNGVGGYSVSLATSGGGGGNARVRNNYITATACVNQPVRIEGSDGSFTKIQTAFNNANSEDTIELQALDFTENPALTNGASVTLKGGYGCDYSEIPMVSTINGQMTIGNGAVTFDRIIIR